MNKYLRAAFCVPFGIIKTGLLKITKGSDFKISGLSMISPHTEITLDRGGSLEIGSNFKMRDGAKIRVRKNAECKLGSNVSLNSFNMIACHEKIIIGDDCQLSPNVQIYDHDHDFTSENGVRDGKYKTAPIIIGNNVWIGANSVILRGTVIGDNAVIGAGCIVKGEVPPDTVLVQKRTSEYKMYEIKEKL